MMATMDYPPNPPFSLALQIESAAAADIDRVVRSRVRQGVQEAITVRIAGSDALREALRGQETR
jgi:hypothetical protein